MISLLEFSKVKKELEELKKQFQMLYSDAHKRSMVDADKVRGITVVTDDPTNGQGLVFDSALNRYKPKGVVTTDGGATISGDQVITGDVRVGGGIVVGNAGANDPGPGEVWLQEQTALPGGTANVNKLINYKNVLHFVDENGGKMPFGTPDGWTNVPETFSYAPTQYNFCPNPSFEANLTDWFTNGAGSSVSRVSPGLWGSYCGRAVMAGAGTAHLLAHNFTGVNGTTYRIGFHARSISGNTALHSELWGGNGVANVTLTTSWQWFSYLGVGSGTNGLYFWLGAAGTFEIDGVHIIQTTLDPPYSDPSITGSGQDWIGATHNSASTRLPVYYLSGNWAGGATFFEPGTKMLVYDGAWKQFYIIAYWVDIIRNITVFIPYAGSNYTPTTAPTYLYVSRVAHPKGFLQWFDFAPAFGGFSVNPTGTHRFRIDGRTCTIVARQIGGTSNATNYWMSLPVREATVLDVPTAQSIDNGATINGATIGEITGKIITFYTTPVGGGWTASGAKYVRTVFSYEWY